MEPRTNLKEEKINQEQEAQFTESSWVKEGDFSLSFNSGADLYKSVTYKNKISKKKEEIFFGGYLGTDNIKIIYRNKALAKKLINKCYELEIPVEDDLIGGVILNSNNKKIITAFLDTIASITSISKSDRNEMESLLPTSLKSEEFKSAPNNTTKWLREGDFSRILYNSSQLCRTVTYKNLKSLKDEEEIFIGAYYGTDKMKIIYSNNNKKVLQDIRKKCTQECIAIDHDFITPSIDLYGNNKKQLVGFINIIDSFRPLGEGVVKEINNILTQDYGMSSKENDDDAVLEDETIDCIFDGKSSQRFALFASKSKENKEVITGEQVNAASLFWTQLLTGERTLDEATKDMPLSVIITSRMLRQASLEKLENKNPLWSLQFMNELDSLIDNHRHDKYLTLKVDYHPEGLLAEAAKKCGIPEMGVFPTKVTMRFDTENNIIVNGKKYAAREIIESVVKMFCSEIKKTTSDDNQYIESPKLSK